MKTEALVLFLSLLSSSAHADWTLVTEEVTKIGPQVVRTNTITTKIQGDKVRVDFGDRSSIIMPSKQEPHIRLSHEDKTYARL